MASGKLWLVSLGPGSLDYLPPAACTALAHAEVVIGYGVYLDLIAPLLDPERQCIIERPLGAEMQRAREALELAHGGAGVALVSSGDIGIYAMAGPVFQQLAALGWAEDPPMIEVIPGISAVQAVAARLGAPIAHDFCCISLSDLLTPWDLIERRVRAAAEADFVVAFYNPRSQERHWQLEAARNILLQHRSPATPVVVARAVARSDEQIRCTTLAKLDVTTVDMFSLVLIGNSQTRRLGPWLATPRGYQEEL
jgi:cobalt-precorrin 5A hydrolase/precorrin-3B C17-methyltransferase